MPSILTVGFWSYVHSDDEYEQGRIVRLRERLEKSIRFHSGESAFRIFLDKKDIGWGQQWKDRIENSLTDALLLFPIVTPSYFRSAACRSEYLAFQERQKKLGRDDLVLPIYYLNADAMEGHGTDVAHNEIAQQLLKHQYEDFRSLRASEETDPSYSKAIERLGSKANDALKRGQVSRPDTVIAASAQSKPVEDEASEQGGAATEAAPSVLKSPPGHVLTLSVNQMPGRGDFTSIADAIARAPGGARITVHPGHYREPIIIDKPLELVGSGNVEDIVIESSDATPVTFDTNIGLIRNFTIRQTASPDNLNKRNGVWIKQGRLELEDCDISSNDAACISVSNNADPRLRRNRVHNGRLSGIVLYGRASGTYEDNELFANGRCGITVSGGAFPVFRRNRSYQNEESSLHVHNGGGGTYEHNEFFENKGSGVFIKDADPILRNNRILSNRNHGVFFSEKARGTVEDNQIAGNLKAGVYVDKAAKPMVRRNKINNNAYEGIWVSEGAEGSFWDNDLTGNEMGAWDLENVDLDKLSIERNIEPQG